jgi:hypothetical protein
MMSEHQGSVRLAASIDLSGKVETLWFTCDRCYASGLASQTCDAFLLAILPLAMRLGLPIKVQGPVSRQLLTNLSDTWMTLASKVMAGTRAVPIEAPQPITRDWGGEGVVTGFSAGIDSFCTIIDQPTGAKVTHLLFNNVGSHGQTDQDAQVFRDRLARLYPVARDVLGLPLIAVDSNLDAILGMDFQLTHTIRNTAVAMLFQSMAGRFLYSSTVHQSDACHGFSDDIGYADSYLLPLLSTETTQCLSSGGEYTRFEKTAIVAASPLTRTTLDICVDPTAAAGINCSKCWKCLRTQLTLEIIDTLREFDAVFDAEVHGRYRWLHLCDVLRSKDKLLAEIATAIDSRDFEVPASARLLAALVPNALIHEVLTGWTHANTKYPFGSASQTPRRLTGCLMRTLRHSARASA